jgi:predicted chitinase
LPEYGITTPERCAAFLGTIKAETDFVKFTENLNYNAYNLYLHKDVITIQDPKTGKPKVIKGVSVNPGHKRFPTLQDAQAAVTAGIQTIANIIYGGRNGNVESGDGYKFRGRGMFQLTGRDNYKLASIQLKKPEILTNPDSVLTNPELCVLTATNFFAKTHCMPHADKADWKEVRLKVNGGLNGYEHMREATEKAYKIFKA